MSLLTSVNQAAPSESYFAGAFSGAVLTNPLGGDLDAGGYSINNCSNITTGLINGFPSFPACIIFSVSNTMSINLTFFSSASYFVNPSGAGNTSILFTYDPKTVPIDNSFWNLQNSDSNAVAIQFDVNGDGGNIQTIGVLSAATGSAPVVGVIVKTAGTYAFF